MILVMTAPPLVQPSDDSDNSDDGYDDVQYNTLINGKYEQLFPWKKLCQSSLDCSMKHMMVPYEM